MTIMGLFMTAFAGFRWETGTDWFNYHHYFQTIENIPIWKSAMEVGYEFIVRTFKTILTTDYTLFLICCALYIISITYYIIYRYSPFPLFSLFLLMSYSFAGSGFGVRQDLAITLTLLSLCFIEQESPIKFVSIVLLASLIHNSALAFLPAYWIYKFQWNTLKVLVSLILVLSCLLFSENILLLSSKFVSARKVTLYMEMGMETAENPYRKLAKGLLGRSIFFLTLVGFVRYDADKENKLFSGLFNLYVFGVIIFAAFSPISLIFGRLARFYDIFQILLIPMAYLRAKRFYKIIIFTVVTVLSILKFTTALEVGEDSFIPYKSFFNK
jgi:hypothetical protein